ncbi:MAG: AAA domain-containing protein [Archangium sp.]|nr:AAA domain-containing protein [Archangium sp.]MDP3151642.1 AAA domain-containing protein [Archangium sp.]MDP3569177.1 AAA domain-containing protein [Archangium sp.]
MRRDVDHFIRFTRLLETERQAERSRIAQEKQTLPLAELEARGLVVLDLETTEENVGLGGRHLVTFMHESKKRLTTRLGPGDILAVSPRKAEIEDPPQGTVVSGTRNSVVVAFDRNPPEWMREGRLRLDVTANDATFDRAKKGLAQWQAMDSGQKRDRREILLGNSPPRFDKPPAFTPHRSLNPEQHEAVSLALSARDVALVHGPPGTGKSTVLSELASQWGAQGKRILCTAASNAAVDHLLELCLDAGLRSVRVGHPARVLPHLQEHTLDLLVEAHPDRQLARELFEDAFDLLGYARKQRSRGRSRERFGNAREASAEAYKMMDDARVLERKATRSILDGAQVVCATLSMLEGSLLRNEQFDVALFDEATQAIEPLSLLAFLKAPLVVMAGDPKQLAPTIISMDAAKQGLGVSLFERLLEDSGDEVKCMLKEQYRMHETIMRFPSDETYGGQLRAHPSVATRTLAEVLRPESTVDAPPLLFLDTAGKGFDESKAPQTESLRNEGEAELVVARVRELFAAGLNPRELGVITPYRAQALWLREQLIDLSELEVDTVDAFQGREKDVIIVSLVRSNAEQQLGFLEDLRRLNVAITRPRRHLFVVGDSATLSSHPFFARWIEFTQAVGGYRSAWEWSSAPPA